jgi:hypothetical protein
MADFVEHFVAKRWKKVTPQPRGSRGQFMPVFPFFIQVIYDIC